MSQIGTWFKKYSLALVCLVFLVWMCHDYWVADPPALGNTYGHNQAGDLQRNAFFLLFELVALYAILRPWSVSFRSLRRFLGAFGLCFCWMCLAALLSMHAGGVSFIHLLWLVLINVGLIVAILSSVVVIDLSD